MIETCVRNRFGNTAVYSGCSPLPAQFSRLAEEAVKQQYGSVRFLEALLAAEQEERERSAIASCIFEAKLPRVKTLEKFRL